ncbi:hypothetical protein [Nocardia asteroides]|uniref:hypothetical protein n=1 Tax=Nocardia asteroides TaxID=1824 RepID=UPI0033D0D61B
MPLPTANMPWPPRHLQDAFNHFSTCQIWWEGDSQKLANAGGMPNRSTTLGSHGGILDRIKRLFWGNKSDKSGSTRQLHAPVAADIARTAATLLLPQPVTFKAAVGDAVDTEPLDNPPVVGEPGTTVWTAQARLDLCLNTPAAHAKMLAAAETCSALGGVYGRIVWNSTLRDHAWIDWVDADRVLPEFSYGELSAVTIWEVVDQQDDEDIVIRHLERHERGYTEYGSDGYENHVPGRIYHALYQGTRVTLGHDVGLWSHPDTAGIPVNEEGWLSTGTDRLTAFYVPNSTSPNPAWRSRSTLRHFGMSDIGDPSVIELMDQIDETWSSLGRDIRLAKARLLVSAFLLESQGPGKGSEFIVDQEVYERVGGAPNANPVIEAHQFAIRVDDHVRSAEAFLRIILRRIGFSPYSFGLSDENGAAMTATEVDAKKDASMATYAARSGIWSGVLAGAARTLLEVDAAVFGTGVVLDEDPDVIWPPASSESMEAKARTLQLLEAAKAVSTEWKVAYVNPRYDEAQIQEEVDRITAASTVADPFTLGADQPVTPVDDVDEYPDGDEGQDDEDTDGDPLAVDEDDPTE